MIVGFDLDGTLTDVSRFMLDKAIELYGLSSVCRHGFIRSTYDFESITFGKMSTEQFWHTYRKEYLESCMDKYAVNGIEHLDKFVRGAGITPVVVTNRMKHIIPSEKDMLINLTEEFVKKYLPTCNQIIYNMNSTKVDEVVGAGIQVYVEDEVSNVIDLSKHIPVIFVNTPYNSDTTRFFQSFNPNIFMAHDLYQIMGSICAYCSKRDIRLDNEFA